MMYRVHESVLIAKLTMMLKVARKQREPDPDYIATLERTIAQLRRQLSRRPQTRQINHRRKHG